ncbi:MAG: hypothetical protein ACLSWR_01955 [Ruthenibacterium sp.]
MDEHLLTQQQMEAIQKNGFKTEMFGFHRAQVLSYLESLSQQYAQQEAELRARAEELQAQVLSAQNMLRESSARENALTVSRDEQARRVHMAQAETQAFRAELLSTREEIHTLHAKLEETEKSLTALQKERDELLASNDGMAAQLQQVRDSLAQQRARADQESRRAKEEMVSAQIRAAELAQKANAQAQKTLEKAKTDAEQLLQDADAKASVRMEQANEQAELIVARAHSEKSQMRDMVARSADDIAASVKVLKAQLAAVDEKIVTAANDLQRATDGIAAALANAERDLQTLGAKMKEFPGRAPERAAVEVKPAFSQPAAAEQVDVQAPAASAAAQPVLSEERAEASDAGKQPDIFEQPAVAASGSAAEDPFFDVLSKIEETQAMPEEADPVPSLSRPVENRAAVQAASASAGQEAWPGARVRPAGQRVPGQRPAAYRPVHARKKRTFLDTLADLLR